VEVTDAVPVKTTTSDCAVTTRTKPNDNNRENSMTAIADTERSGQKDTEFSGSEHVDLERDDQSSKHEMRRR
jgi:hypothetical protein